MSGRIPRSILVSLILAFLVSAPLTGCGQKGPLFLPDPAEEQEQGEKAEDES